MQLITLHQDIHNVSTNHIPKWKVAEKFACPRGLSALSIFALVFVLFPVAGSTQQIAQSSSFNSSLPDAPLPQGDTLPLGGSSAAALETSSISGTVLDPTGARVVGVQVTLTQHNGTVLQTTTSGGDGQFTFSGLRAGTYIVKIEATGFATFTTQEFTVVEQESHLLPTISLTVKAADTSIEVRPTEEIAAEQIKAEEKQRLLGVIPNFYVSYVPDAAPLTSKQKFSLATHETLDWTSFVGASWGAGFQQATNAFKGYGQGAAGYGKRWGALFADGRISDFTGHYIFASLLHQDPRYFYQGTGTTKSRLYHALGSAFVARSDSGKTMPNYSYLLSAMVAGAISNAYYPSSDRGPNLVFTNAAIGIAGRASEAVFQEFFAKRLTKHVPDPNAAPDPKPSAPTNPPPHSSSDKSNSTP
jgi:hypothetical protein